MDYGNIDWIALVVAVVASYAFSAIFYIALARPWMAAIGKTEAELKTMKNPVLPYVVAVGGQVVIAYTLMNLMLALGMLSPGGGVTLAITLWIGFVMTTMAINHRFQDSTWSHTLIDGAHWLAVLVIQAVAIGFLMG